MCVCDIGVHAAIGLKPDMDGGPHGHPWGLMGAHAVPQGCMASGGVRVELLKALQCEVGYGRREVGSGKQEVERGPARRRSIYIVIHITVGSQEDVVLISGYGRSRLRKRPKESGYETRFCGYQKSLLPCKG